MTLIILPAVLLVVALVYSKLRRNKLVIPAPTGVYQVGYQERVIMDPARVSERAASGFRSLLVSLYYPTEAKEGKAVAYLPEGDVIIKNLSKVFGLPESAFASIADSKTNSFYNAPIASLKELPVVIFSHSINGTRVQSTFLLEELASHGYLVVGIEHTDYSVGALFPDGAIGEYLKENILQDTAEGAEMIDVWSRDQLFVYEQLQRLNSEGILFSTKVNLGRAGLLGHSFGGAASFNTVTVSDSFDSAVNLDGFYFGENYIRGTIKPLLEIRSQPKPTEEMTERQLQQIAMSRDQYQAMMFDEWEHRLRLYAKGPCYRYTLDGAKHLSFTDLMLAIPFKGVLAGDLRYCHDQTRALTKAFFDHTLKGEPSRLVEGSIVRYPEKAISA